MVRSVSVKAGNSSCPDSADLATAMLWGRDREGRIVFSDPCCQELFGEDLSLGRFLEIAHPNDRGLLSSLQQDLQAGGRIPDKLEYRLRDHTGDYRWVVERNLPRALNDPSLGQVVGVAFDITARKLSAHRLRESEERFRDFVEVAGDWIFEMDADLRFTFLGERFYKLFAFRPADIIGKTRQQLAGGLADDDIWRGHLDDLANRRPIRNFEYEVTLPSGSCGCIEVNAKPIYDDDGSFRGYRGTGTDRTAMMMARKALEQSERQFRDLAEGSIQGLYIHKDWRLMFANQALAGMFGYDDSDEILAVGTLDRLVAPDERDRLWGYNVARRSGGAAPELYEARCVKKDGSPIWAEFRVKQVEWQGAAAIQCAVIDISERKRAEAAVRKQHEELRKRDRELRTQNDRFNAALAHMSQGLCMFDAEQRLVVCNERYVGMYNLSPDLARRGTPFRKIVEHRIKSGVYAGQQPERYIQERLAAVMEDKRSTKVQQLTDGRAIAIVHQPMPGGGWVATHEDITELQRIEAQIAHMAHHDALTDLPNRALLRERIEAALQLARRGQSFAVLCLDLDRFKSVNDTLGHPAGDELLRQVAERLRSCVRDSDTIARLGGDEFAIIQVAEVQPNDATALAGRICELIKEPFDLHGHQVVIDTSIGIAIAPDDGADPDQLLRNADIALYRAKGDGRGVYRFFEAEMDARIKERRGLELSLRKALEIGEFELHYQPLVCLKTNEVSGFEALVRWRHPERGLVPPGDFIPLAEETGLIVPLGEWVIRKACAEAATWPDHVNVAVNLSPLQFRSERLVPVVLNALAASGMAARRLELEITESVLLQNNEATLRTLHRLRDLGVRIAMDDFGTGYSSLSYLRSFPFDKIKIDRSFIQALSEGEDAVAIVRAVASLSNSLGMTTTAEGVETEEQLERVRAEGYTEMQGYLFSPPRPAEEIAALFFPPARRAVGRL